MDVDVVESQCVSFAGATAEEAETILDIYEPYLMRLGFISLTPRGRVATQSAFERLKIKPPKNYSLL